MSSPAQPRQSQREMVNGESHYFLGQRYRLRVHEHDAPPRVVVRGIASLGYAPAALAAVPGDAQRLASGA